MRRTAVAAALLACSLVAPSAATAQLSRPKIDTVGSRVVRVMNPGPTAWADTNGWKLVLERTIQPAAGQPGELEDPTGIVLLRDGRVVISQRQPAMIRLYDAQGHFVRSIGRDGDGPAEYRTPLIAVRGDTVVAFSGGLGRVTMLTLAGARVREFLTNTHHDGPPISIDARGRLRVTGSRMGAGAFRTQWLYFDLMGKRLDSLIPPESVVPKTWTVKTDGGVATYYPPLAPTTQHAFRSDGGILYGAGDRYQLFLTRQGTDTLLIFGRTGITSAQIPSHYRDSLFDLYARRPELAAVAVKSDIPTTYSLWNEATFDGNGNPWVSSGQRSTRTLRFDVFAPNGRYLGAVPAPFPSFYGTSWTGDRVAVIGADNNELPIVRIYRIDRRGK